MESGALLVHGVNRQVEFLRIVGLLEGISFLLLLGVAMPLKYVWGQPLAVKIAGMAHGVLFLLLIVALIRVVALANWPVKRAGMVFLAALLPFGPFVIDRKMRHYAASADGQP